jgi:hypothetical protein
MENPIKIALPVQSSMVNFPLAQVNPEFKDDSDSMRIVQKDGQGKLPR